MMKWKGQSGAQLRYRPGSYFYPMRAVVRSLQTDVTGLYGPDIQPGCLVFDKIARQRRRGL